MSTALLVNLKVKFTLVVIINFEDLKQQENVYRCKELEIEIVILFDKKAG